MIEQHILSARMRHEARTGASASPAKDGADGRSGAPEGASREKRHASPEKRHASREKRRGFLRLLGVSGVVGSAVAMLGGRAQAAMVTQPEEGYHETEHVARYYESARF